MKKLSIVIILFIASLGTAFAQNCANFVYGGEFPKYLKSDSSYTVLCKKEFVLGYSKILKSVIWTGYKIQAEKITSPNEISSASFKLDPMLLKTDQYSLSDYVGSGFDRGHMVPFEDMNHNKEAALESMMLTNVLPQYPSINRGIWRIIELKIREDSLIGDLFVITGPVYTTNSYKGDLLVPDYFFKVIIDPIKKSVITYLIPNISSTISFSLIDNYTIDRKRLTSIIGIDVTPITNLTDKK